MKFGKIFKIFKKGAKAASKRSGQKGEVTTDFDWPSGIRIGVFGHANAGKTVYYTVLNEECKISKKLQISVTDTSTANEFLNNYRSIWGLGTSAEAGTVVDLRGEKNFPEPTEEDKVLQFTAIVDLSKKLSIVAYDYNGKAVSISSEDELTDKVIDFMTGCDGLLFFFDPKILHAELECQAHVASFVNMVERLGSFNKRLPIPISLVVTKADILPGFTGDSEVKIVRDEDEYLFSENFELFLDKVLSQNQIKASSDWAGSVRNVLVKLKEFLRVVLGRTLDFQVFFISATGATPEKVGTEVGRSIYKPPERMKPVGVKEPFYWLINSIMRNRRISRLRNLSKYVAVLSIIWVAVFSIPFLMHFEWTLRKPVQMEDKILKDYDGNRMNLTNDERNRIIREYDVYERSKLVRWFFESYLIPARRILSAYKEYDQGEAIKSLDGFIGRFTAIVKDTALWPKLNLSDSTVFLNETHEGLVAGLEAFHKGDSTSTLYTRSDRVLNLWNMFIQQVQRPDDTLIWKAIQDQVQTYRSLFGRDMSSEEFKLGDALTERKVKKVKKAEQQKVVLNFDELKEKINGNNSPSYRLGTAVTELEKAANVLEPSSPEYKMIRNYLNEVRQWKKVRSFRFKAESIPEGGHLHIDVTEKGKEPTWQNDDQILEGFEFNIRWKIGYVIHVAFHYPHLDGKESWGKEADDRRTFDSKYSLFDLEKGILFEKLGKKAVLRFTPPLEEQLPELK